jgi:hypothetical protein
MILFTDTLRYTEYDYHFDINNNSSQTLFDLTLYCYIRKQRIFSLDNTFCTDSLQFKQAFPVAYKSVESDNFRGDFLVQKL